MRDWSYPWISASTEVCRHAGRHTCPPRRETPQNTSLSPAILVEAAEGSEVWNIDLCVNGRRLCPGLLQMRPGLTWPPRAAVVAYSGRLELLEAACKCQCSVGLSGGPPLFQGEYPGQVGVFNWHYPSRVWDRHSTGQRSQKELAG